MRKTILALIVVATCSLANSSATKYKAEIEAIDKEIKLKDSNYKKDIEALRVKRITAEKNLAKAEGKTYTGEDDWEKKWEDMKKEDESFKSNNPSPSRFMSN